LVAFGSRLAMTEGIHGERAPFAALDPGFRRGDGKAC